MTLAYTFWHSPAAEVPAEAYERDLALFHERLAMTPIDGFLRSHSLRVPPLPWLPGGGYEDWYLLDDFAALGPLATGAVDPARLDSHDALARTVREGTGGLYALRFGEPTLTGENGVGWAAKPLGVPYSQVYSILDEQVTLGVLTAVWQRQLVLGPAPEFRLEAAAPVEVPGLELRVRVTMGHVIDGSFRRP